MTPDELFEELYELAFDAVDEALEKGGLVDSNGRQVDNEEIVLLSITQFYASNNGSDRHGIECITAGCPDTVRNLRYLADLVDARWPEDEWLATRDYVSALREAADEL